MTPVFCMAVCLIAMLGSGLFAEPKPCKGTNFLFWKKKKIQETCCSIYIYIGVRKVLKIKTFGGIFRMAILTKGMFMNAHYKYRRSDVNIGPTSFFWKFVSDTCMDKQESDV